MPTKNSNNKTIRELIIEYFKAHPKQDMTHGPVVDWVEKKRLQMGYEKPRDTWRGVRNLHEEGLLIKVKEGIYRYDPDFIEKKDFEDFTAKQKKQILERYNYKCSHCGRKQDEGYELHVDHKLPKNKGGRATIENGQVLCSVCNFRKKNYGQTESGKRMFIGLWETAKNINDKKNLPFFEKILSTFEEFGVNGHIEWKK